MSPFTATSSLIDNPGRFGYLHTSLSTLSKSNVASGVDVQSPAISLELDVISHTEIGGDRVRSQMLITDATFDLLNVESEVWRYPKRPGSYIGDDVAEYGNI